MLDFLAGHKRADVPPGGWPSGWLNASKDVTIVHALLLAHEMDVYGLKQLFGQILKTQEAAGCVDYKRVFREAAVGGNAELGAYFAARIWADEWEKKQKIDVWQAFSVQQVAGIPPAYLYAFSQPLMVDEAGKRRGDHHPLGPTTQGSIAVIEKHFEAALDSYSGELPGTFSELTPSR